MPLHPVTWLGVLSICGLLTISSASDELVELMCVDEKSCAAFQQPHLVVNCVEHLCECANATGGEKVECKAKELRRSNVIGGSCPCTMPKGECDDTHDICHCAKDYIPSTDTRRCLYKSAELGDMCELESQCKATDPFALCQERRCECRQNFTEIDRKCESVIVPTTNCTSDKDCRTLSHKTRCHLDQHICTCEEGFVFANETQTCLRRAGYETGCRFDIQCQAVMGEGGFCCRGVRVCLCARMFYPWKLEGDNGTSTTICKAAPVAGNYCVTDADCHTPIVPAENQTMDCFFGLCNCKHGFMSMDDGSCTRGSDGRKLQASGIFIILAYLLVLSQRF